MKPNSKFIYSNTFISIDDSIKKQEIWRQKQIFMFFKATFALDFYFLALSRSKLEITGPFFFLIYEADEEIITKQLKSHLKKN